MSIVVLIAVNGDNEKSLSPMILASPYGIACDATRVVNTYPWWTIKDGDRSHSYNTFAMRA